MSPVPGGLTHVPRPQPRLDPDTRAFWTGGAQGKLMLNRCQACGLYIHPPKPVCRHCLSDDVKPEAVAGTGVVDTFTVNHQAWYPGLEVPFVIARIAIDGAPGVYVTSNVIGSPVDEVDIGDRVRVTFEQQDDVYFPLFEKVAR
jgi:uncharacterized OB-fold protein